MDDKSLIQAFHMMWDSFPGMARLINRKHMVLAGNGVAEAMGYIAGTSCARVHAPDMHRGCRMIKALNSGEAQMDFGNDNRIRGWLPVEGRQDVIVHFVMMLPAGNNSRQS